jgi:hypothetical protein
MCLTIPGQGNQCTDMCNTKIPLDTFHDTPGKQAGTVAIVEMVRAGRDPAGLTTCPGPSVWIWLWIPILLCCLIGFCALAYYMWNYYRQRLKRGRSGYREPEPGYVEDQVPYADYQQVSPQDMEYDQMAPPQTMDMDQTLEPMPVAEPYQEIAPQTAMPLLEEKAVELSGPNLFGDPSLMGGFAPAAVAAPAAYAIGGPTYAQPYMLQPQATSMAVSNYGGLSGYGGSAYQSRPMVGGVVTGASVPSYGAYGAYGAPNAYGGANVTTYPGTTSMRIG